MKKIKVTKLIKWFIVLTMVLCICSGFVVAGKGYSMYRNALDQMSLADKVESIQDKEHYTTFEELPEVYVNAVVSVEEPCLMTCVQAGSWRAEAPSPSSWQRIFTSARKRR